MTGNIDLPSAAIAECCRRHHVHEMAVFGSALRRDFSEKSDIDLLVEFEPGAKVGFLTLAHLSRELSELLGRKVDVVPKGGLKPAIRSEILAQAKILYAA